MADSWAECYPLPSKGKLLDLFRDVAISDIPVPAYIIDRSVFSKNCEDMLKRAEAMGATFRPHLKSHKTLEGARLMLGNGKANAAIVSTLREAWFLIPLVQEGILEDILYSLPPAKSRLEELFALKGNVGDFTLLIDNLAQVEMLAFEPRSNPWSIFIKVDCGTHRAGLEPLSPEIRDLIEVSLNRSFVKLKGFYTHSGHSYSSTNIGQARDFLDEELHTAYGAAKVAEHIMREKGEEPMSFLLSVGATPTAHAISEGSLPILADIRRHGYQLELHAGNYPLLDLQQLSTGCIQANSISGSVLGEIVSVYPSRGEALVNTGTLALGREPGKGEWANCWGVVVGEHNWVIGRQSQEHGILTKRDSRIPSRSWKVGEKVRITPQHSCISAAGFGWYYIVDSNDDGKTIVDIWVRCRGW